MSHVRIYEIRKISVTLLKSNPPSLCIAVNGSASSTGWTDPQLSPWVYIDPPKDGIQDFDFIAKRPTGIVLPVITPINADTLIENIDIPNYWGKGKPLKGIRVHATSNNKEHNFSKKMSRKSCVTIAKDTDPWPW